MAPDPNGSTKSQDVCGYYGLELRPFSGPERSANFNASILLKSFEDLGLSKISGPAYPSYSTYSCRLKTYDTWKIPNIQKPEKLSEAGFYYTGTQDNVLCFHCGGGLKNWEKEDDPWVEHAKWFNRCGFVILQKGRTFINDVLEKADALYESENEIKETKIKSESSHKIGEKAEDKSKKAKEPNKSPAKLEEPSRSTESLNLDKKEIELCRICYTNEREIVFLPCGHFVSCSQCAPSLSMCAVCRKPFEAVVRAYLS